MSLLLNLIFSFVKTIYECLFYIAKNKSCAFVSLGQDVLNHNKNLEI